MTCQRMWIVNWHTLLVNEVAACDFYYVAWMFLPMLANDGLWLPCPLCRPQSQYALWVMHTGPRLSHTPVSVIRIAEIRMCVRVCACWAM